MGKNNDNQPTAQEIRDKHYEENGVDAQGNAPRAATGDFEADEQVDESNQE